MPGSFHFSIHHVRSLLLLASCLLAGFGAFGVFLETPELVLSLDGAHGRIVSLLDKGNGHEFIVPDSAGDLWQLDFSGQAGGRITPGDAGAFSYERDAASPHILRFVWQEFCLEHVREMAVHVTAAGLPDTAAIRWNIEVRHLNDAAPVTVRFPRVPQITRQESEVLAAPYWMGEKTTQARQLLQGGRRREWSYPRLLSMQCITFYKQGGPGLYLFADDIEARSKSFAVFGCDQAGLGLEVCHFPGVDDVTGGVYTPGYGVTLGMFEGDWITVAERYRQWALEQPWARNSRLKNRQTPEWAANTGFWVWNRDHSENVLPPAVQLQEYLGLPVSVFWHWWHGCAYDVNFPEYLPPREGAEPFRAALETAQEEGVRAIVYMNQRLWGMTAESWETKNAERYAVKGVDGAVRPEVYNTFTQSPCASMCMGTAFWRDTYAGLSEEVFTTLGVNSIYMDQACSSLVCYDPRHEHTPGGGTYWMEGFRALEQDIRERCPGIALAGEGVGEAWLPHLDLMLSLQVSMERYAAPGQWEPIPFFHAVYHGYVVLYGNYASLTYPPYDSLWPSAFAPETPLQLLDAKFRHQFRLEQGRAFVWGQQPCLANFTPVQLKERAAELDFIKRLAILRDKTKPYLLHGTFVRPPVMNIADMKIPMSRLSIYAGQKDAVQEYIKVVPRLLAGAWRDEKGNLAIPIVNISDGPEPITLHLNSEEHGLPEQGIVYKIRPDERLEIMRFDQGTVRVVDTLNSAEARVYELIGI